MEFANYMEGEKLREELELNRMRWLGAAMYNSSGNMKRGKTMKPTDLLKLDMDKPKHITKEDDIIRPKPEEIIKAWQQKTQRG